MIKTVYLAGPDVFLSDNTAERKKSLCVAAGLTPLFPLDNEITGPDPAPAIFKANIDMIEACDAIIANVTPFRGPSCDPGTAFEIGYAASLGKGIFCYSADARDLKLRIDQDYPQYCSDGMAIEEFGYQDNLMIACVDCIDVVHQIGLDDAQSAFAAFQLSLSRIRLANASIQP